MANVELTFFGTNEEYRTKLVCGINNHNEIYIRTTNIDDEDQFEFITLDKSTAIRLAKQLRTEINKIVEVSDE